MFQKSILTLVTLLLVSTIHGQTTTTRKPMMASVDPSFFDGLRYRLVGPSRGGRVTTVAGVPSQPKTFYMGVVDQKIGRDAIERYGVLKKEFDGVKAEADQVLGAQR